MTQTINRFAILCLVPLLVLGACKSTGKKSGGQTAQESSDLTWEQAQSRKARVSDVQYAVTVKLSEPDAQFTGESEIRFNLKGAGQPLRVDFYEGQIASMKLNDQDVPAESKKPYWIELPASLLKEGANTLKIAYTQNYSRQGQGLHKFTDPQTKEVFLYTQFQTFDANRFMPAFDQPDLRSVLTLTVDAPATWEVITTTRETKVSSAQNGRKVWSFPATDPLPTYLFSLHAGPYKIFKDQYQDIPLRLYVRPSMAKHLRTKEWFKYTKQGLQFFNSYFGMNYPFKKYDQLVVPEFNAGAMENVGAVTFSERYLWRSQPSRDDLRGLASVILHEMAHMWFGDIVTMKWWNDLWLNESFATFMASLALAEATEFKEAWQDFFTSDKNWAYWEDSLSTTHPIEAPVKSVKDAYANFDGITYGKGAAVLRQLNAYVTAEAFKKGIQSFIKTYAFKNAEQKEFIASLQTATQRDLSLWAQRWLQQSGTDKISAQWSCVEGRLEQLVLNVTPTPGAAFRPQTVQVALFQEDKGELKPAQAVRVDLTKPQEIVKGSWSCPAFVYPNYQDEGYIAVSLDPKSLDFARKNLSRINEPLLRTMVWDDLWEMVRNTEMPLKDYVQIVNTHFPKENDLLLTDQIVSTISGRWSEEVAILNYWPQTDERSRKDYLNFVTSMENEYLRRFKSAKAGTDHQRQWFDNYLRIVRSPKGLDQLATWANMKNVAPGLPLDVDRQWQVVTKLARYQHPKAKDLLVTMKKKDPSDRGQRQAMAVEAIQPDLKVKQKWVTLFKQPKPEISFAEARSVLRSLFPLEQKALAKNFAEDFYTYLQQNGRSENENMVESVANSLVPLSCAEAESKRLKQFLNRSELFTPSVAKILKINLDEDERCQRIRAMSSL